MPVDEKEFYHVELIQEMYKVKTCCYRNGTTGIRYRKITEGNRKARVAETGKVLPRSRDECSQNQVEKGDPLETFIKRK